MPRKAACKNQASNEKEAITGTGTSNGVSRGAIGFDLMQDEDPDFRLSTTRIFRSSKVAKTKAKESCKPEKKTRSRPNKKCDRQENNSANSKECQAFKENMSDKPTARENKTKNEQTDRCQFNNDTFCNVRRNKIKNLESIQLVPVDTESSCSSPGSDLPPMLSLVSEDMTYAETEKEKMTSPVPEVSSTGDGEVTNSTSKENFNSFVGNFKFNSRSDATSEHFNLANEKSRQYGYRTELVESDALIAIELQKEENLKAQANVPSLSFDVCQFCMKDISHYNSIRKQQHINRCCDVHTDVSNAKGSTKEKEEGKSQEKKLCCPICGKENKNEKGRKVHMKQCCKKNNISTAELILLLKTLEDTETGSSADTPVEKVATKEATLTAKVTKSKVTTTTRKKTRTKDLDKAAQLAVALSASESTLKADENRRKRIAKRAKIITDLPDLISISEEEKKQKVDQKVTDLIKDDNCEEISCTPALNPSRIADRYAVVKEFNEQRRLRQSLHHADTDVASKQEPCLSDDEDVEVGKQGFKDTETKTDELYNTEEESTNSEKHTTLSLWTKDSVTSTQNHLWNLASEQDDHINERPFYVNGFLSVFEENCDSLKKELEKDTKRDPSPIKERSVFIHEEENKKTKSEKHIEDNSMKEKSYTSQTSEGIKENDSSPVATDSQLAHMIANIADDTDNNDDDYFLDSSNESLPKMTTTQSVAPKANHTPPSDEDITGDGFIKSHMSSELESQLADLKSDASKQLLASFEALLLNEYFSDITIQCQHGIDIHAHKLVLATRSSILKDLLEDDPSTLDLTEFSEHAVKALLRYIYCGDIVLDSYVIGDVLKMAERFQFEILRKTCQLYIETDPTLIDSSSKANGNEVDTNVVDMKEIADEVASDEETAEDEMEHFEGNEEDDEWIQASIAVLLEKSFSEEPVEITEDTKSDTEESKSANPQPQEIDAVKDLFESESDEEEGQKKYIQFYCVLCFSAIVRGRHL